MPSDEGWNRPKTDTVLCAKGGVNYPIPVHFQSSDNGQKSLRYIHDAARLRPCTFDVLVNIEQTTSSARFL